MKERQLHVEFIHKEKRFSYKPWFKRLAGISTTVGIDRDWMYQPGFAVYMTLGDESN